MVPRSSLRSCCLVLAFLLSVLLASVASAATIEVTYELLYAGVGPSGNATTLSRNQVTNTPFGLGNANREIGTPRLGAAYGGPAVAFSPSTIVISFQECGGQICDGPVTLENLQINEQFIIQFVQTDLYIETIGGGTAYGMLTAGTINWAVPESNWNTVGGVFCNSPNLCAFGGLVTGWNPQDGVTSQTLGNFVFGAGGPAAGAGFNSNFITSATANAVVTTFLSTQEISRVIVPEPTTGTLLAVGLLALAWKRRSEAR